MRRLRPVLAAVALVAAVAPTAAHATGCTPATTTLTPGALTWDLYYRPDLTAYAYEWHGSGFAAVSDDCAGRLDLTVLVTDHATDGNSPDVAGYQGYAYDPSADNGTFRAAAVSDDLVVYYDLPALYVRGTSVVELRVSATYYDTASGTTVSLGCRATYTSVTPLPTGPSTSTGPAQDCAS